MQLRYHNGYVNRLTYPNIKIILLFIITRCRQMLELIMLPLKQNTELMSSDYFDSDYVTSFTHFSIVYNYSFN